MSLSLNYSYMIKYESVNFIISNVNRLKKEGLTSYFRADFLVYEAYQKFLCNRPY